MIKKKGILITIIGVVFAIANTTGQSVWSKTWNAGDTDYTNRVKSTRLINDTLYYVIFNVCDVANGTFSECNTIGMLNMEGKIINERLYSEISIKEHGNIPWQIIDNKIVLGDGSGTKMIQNFKVHQLSRFSLDILQTDVYNLEYDTEQLFITGLIEYKDYFVASGITQVADTTVYPDILIWIDKTTMEIDTITSYPFEKESVIPEFLFVGIDSLITYYYSGLFLDNDGFGGRGFIKHDKNKELVFDYLDTIDLGTGHQYEHTAYQLENGNMIYKQTYDNSEQPWPRPWNSDFDILCIDPQGEIVWRFNKPGYSYTAGTGFVGFKRIVNMTETAHGDILACGNINWHFNYPNIFEYNFLEDTLPPLPDSLEIYTAPYIIKIDGETGEYMWQYSIIEYDEYGNIRPYALRQVHELSDGSIIGSGWSQIYDEIGNHIKDESWAVRLPADGCISADGMECGFESYIPTSISDPILIDLMENKPFIFYPNPSNGRFYVKDNRDHKDKVSVDIFTTQGDLLLNIKNINLIDLDLTMFSTNVFICKISTEKGKVLQTEILVKRGNR